MKIRIILATFVATSILLAGCSKDMDSNVDVTRYENQLSGDYTRASQYHTDMASGANVDYNNTMFRQCDSLFSVHFYEFCKDMSNSGGMMNGKGGMMNSGAGMHGNMSEMMSYINELYRQGQTTPNADFMRIDSLMYSKMQQCNMMNSQTNGVRNIYSNMQSLRQGHMRLNK